ncbi:plasmid mobilization protein [Streptomyces sp. NPDC085927]|uniref:plasmid mobilization protein n=1 Tax=Streptomyces sp. NPDC085927 TaxID=3365738 RepID=UPI0037D2B2B1
MGKCHGPTAASARRSSRPDRPVAHSEKGRRARTRPRRTGRRRRPGRRHPAPHPLNEARYLMATPHVNGTTPEPASRSNSLSRRASYPLGYSALSGVSKGSSAPSGRGLVRRRGTPDEEAATEGGSQPQGEDGGHDHAAPSRTRRRKYQRRQRPHVRNTRFSDAELARVTAGAKAAGLTLAGFLARAALSAARDLDRTASAVASEREVIAEFFAARRHLGQVGNNLNQITRAINAGAHPPELDVVIAATERAVQRVQHATDQLLQQD